MNATMLIVVTVLITLVAPVNSRALAADTVKVDLPIVGTYPNISDAYSAASDGATIMLQGIPFVENLSFGAAKAVIIKGGFNPDFTPNGGNSTVRGTLTISGGTVRVQNIVVRYAGNVPEAPTGVSATIGTIPDTVVVTIGTPPANGSSVSSYTVISSPPGITATGAASPITVPCTTPCTGYTFSVIASNDIGDSAPSALADVITNYNVTETFYEPVTKPRDSIFIGSFTFNSTTSTVTNLHGILSESMTGDPIAIPTYDYGMTWLPLLNQLSSVYDASLGGLLVTTFLLPTTNTFTVDPLFHGTDGWTPGTGLGLYYGFPALPAPDAGGVGNAYAMIFVNTSNPTAALTQAQINKLAYADCTAGGMMGGTCMTGTTLEGYGSAGTMGGYPVSQVITKQ